MIVLELLLGLSDTTYQTFHAMFGRVYWVGAEAERNINGDGTGFIQHVSGEYLECSFENTLLRLIITSSSDIGKKLADGILTQEANIDYYCHDDWLKNEDNEKTRKGNRNNTILKLFVLT